MKAFVAYEENLVSVQDREGIGEDDYKGTQVYSGKVLKVHRTKAAGFRYSSEGPLGGFDLPKDTPEAYVVSYLGSDYYTYGGFENRLVVVDVLATSEEANELLKALTEHLKTDRFDGLHWEGRTYTSPNTFSSVKNPSIVCVGVVE